MMEKVRIRASVLAVAMIIATAAAAAFGTASGATYTVGEPGGSWDVRTNLTAWASAIAFHAGDQLVFKYDATAHDVVEVTRAGYRSCSAASPVGAALRTGSDAVRLDGGAGAAGRRRYFICSTPGHCAAGMKLEVRVVDDGECTNRLPPPGPAPPGAPGGITICSGSPPVVISTPGVISYGAAPPRSSSAGGLGTVVATVVMVSLLLGLAIV